MLWFGNKLIKRLFKKNNLVINSSEHFNDIQWEVLEEKND